MKERCEGCGLHPLRFQFPLRSVWNWQIIFLNLQQILKRVANAALIAVSGVWYPADIPQREPDVDAFLSIKPGIPLAQELEQVLVLVGQIENHESLARDEEHMNPHEVVEHPACRRILDALAFLVWKCGRMLLEGGANPILQGCIHQQTDGHHHQQGHDAFRLFEIERGRQKLRIFQEAKPAFSPGLPFVSGQHLWRWQLGLVQFVRGKDKTAVLVNTRLAVREPRRQGSSDMVDALVGLGARAWAPPLPIVGRGGDGTVREKRGLHVVGKTRQGLLGIRCTGEGGAAQRLEGFDFVGTLLAPLLVDSALGLRLARLRVDEHPTLRDTPIARWHHAVAIALRERRHCLGGELGPRPPGLRSRSQGRA